MVTFLAIEDEDIGSGFGGFTFPEDLSAVDNLNIQLGLYDGG